MIDYDYSFCSAQCRNASCFRNQINLPHGKRMILTISDFSGTDVCPLNQRKDDEDEQVQILYPRPEQGD